MNVNEKYKKGKIRMNQNQLLQIGKEILKKENIVAT